MNDNAVSTMCFVSICISDLYFLGCVHVFPFQTVVRLNMPCCCIPLSFPFVNSSPSGKRSGFLHMFRGKVYFTFVTRHKVPSVRDRTWRRASLIRAADWRSLLSTIPAMWRLWSQPTALPSKKSLSVHQVVPLVSREANSTGREASFLWRRLFCAWNTLWLLLFKGYDRCPEFLWPWKHKEHSDNFISFSSRRVKEGCLPFYILVLWNSLRASKSIDFLASSRSFHSALLKFPVAAQSRICTHTRSIQTKENVIFVADFWTRRRCTGTWSKRGNAEGVTFRCLKMCWKKTAISFPKCLFTSFQTLRSEGLFPESPFLFGMLQDTQLHCENASVYHSWTWKSSPLVFGVDWCPSTAEARGSSNILHAVVRGSSVTFLGRLVLGRLLSSFALRALVSEASRVSVLDAC